MIRFRPLWLMTALALAALALLLLLGRWQWERYEFKRAAAAEPVPEVIIADYQPAAEGVQFVYGVRPDTHEQGWRVFVPVAEGERYVFVDADFAPGVAAPRVEEVRLPALLRSGAPIRGASLEARPPSARERGLGQWLAQMPLLSFPSRPLERQWGQIDLTAMGRNAGLAPVADYYVAAAYVTVDGRATPNPFALARGADALPAERHLGYALTWFGLAGALLAVYFFYHASVGRLAFAPRPRKD
jgi:surfeit locus 1 family protein